MDKKWEPDELWLAIYNSGEGQEGGMASLFKRVAHMCSINPLVAAAFRTRDKGVEALCTAVIALVERQQTLEESLVDMKMSHCATVIQVIATDIAPEFGEKLRDEEEW